MTEATAKTAAIQEPPYAPYLRYIAQIPKPHLALMALWVTAAMSIFFSIPILTFPDTISYRNASLQPLLPLTDFLYSERALSFPLVIKFFYSDLAITYFQLLLFITSWGFLFLVVSDVIKPAALGSACIFLLSLASLSWVFFFWNRAILSESISLSGFVLVFALLCRFFLSSSPSRLLIYSIVPIWVFWENSRDTNAFFSLSAAAIFLLVFAVNALQDKGNHKWKAGWLMMGLILAATAFQISAFNAKNSEWRVNYPLIDVLGQRILPSPERTAELVKLGMPMNDKVMCFKGKLWWDCAKDYSGFGDWLKSGEGRRTYMIWLMQNMGYTFKSAIADRDIIFSKNFSGYTEDITVNPFSAFFSTLALPSGKALPVFICIAVIAFLAAGFHSIKTKFRHWIVIPAGVFLSAVPLALACYHGDAAGVDRHSLVVQMDVYAIGWVLIFWLISTFVTKTKPGT